MKASNNYRPETRSRYAKDAIVWRLPDLMLEDAEYILRRITQRVRELQYQALDQAEQDSQAAPATKIPSITYQLEYVKCGKPSCKKCGNGPGHGPYYYAYWETNGKTHSKYIGKNKPPEAK